MKRFDWARGARAFVLLAAALALGPATAQRLGTFNRVTTPNGRQVLEIRQGLHPANSQLLFTAVITAGPTGGTTSVLLQQALVRDIFNQNAPAAGWTVVRSTATAFSLGGGCGRSNLIDFPYINNNRPEILRITGTTQQVITLGIAGTDQYDSIDCRTQPDGRVLYMLTNRTRQRLEFRREQGGLLQLVRDNFGNVATPFRGGQRPSFAIRRFPPGATAADATAEGGPASAGDPLPANRIFASYDYFSGVSQVFRDVVLLDTDEPLTERFRCPIDFRPDPGTFNGVRESAVVSSFLLGKAPLADAIQAIRFLIGAGGCTTQPAETVANPPFTLYNFAGVAASEGYARSPFIGHHDILVVPGQVVTSDGFVQDVRPSPFGTRGGPVWLCPMFGPEIETAAMLVGPGTTSAQVQQSVALPDISEIVFGTGMEEQLDGAEVHCDAPPG